MTRDLPGLLRDLKREYLVVEGLMASPVNKGILPMFITYANDLYKEVMLKCQSLGENDILPDSSNVTKSSVIKSKLEFDERVREWLDRAERAAANSGSETESDSDQTESQSEIDCRLSSHSSRSRPSYSSVRSQKVKESLVKLRMATFARELQYEHSRQNEIMQEVLRKAERARDEAERALKGVQDSIKQDALRREKDYEVRLATEEAKAWEEVRCKRGSVKSVSTLSAAAAPKHKLTLGGSVGKGDGTVKGLCGRNVAPWRREVKTYKSEFENEVAKPLQSHSRCPEPETPPKPILAPVLCNGGSDLVNDVVSDGATAAKEPWKGVSVSDKPVYASQRLEPVSCKNEITSSSCWGPTRPLQTDALASAARPKHLVESEQSIYRQGFAPTTTVSGRMGAMMQDYPPPKPVIPCFDGDPLMFWTFVRSFDTHIAAKMPSDAARLVYLLQHCTPKVRHGLEHFSRDNTTGYRLARESLFNDYGQPHTIAYCCEQKLLNSPRLKFKDPSGLKDLAILMDKCLGIMEDIGDFATLNSFGTIKRITDKLSEEMQREWVRWAFRVLKTTGHQAKFKELVEFVRHESDEANSLYGKSFYSGSKPLMCSQPSAKRSSSFGTAVYRGENARTNHASGPCCPYCKGGHNLNSCDDFKNISRSKRIDYLRKENRCFRCLAKGHVVGDCRSRLVCEVDGCGRRSHHTLLHIYPSDLSEVASGSKTPVGAMCATLCGSLQNETRNDSCCYFMTVPVKVRYKNKTTKTYALLDSGSQRTFCEKELARRLGASGPREVLPIQTLSSGSDPAVVDGMLIPLSVTSLTHGNEVELHEVLTVDAIPLRAAVPIALEINQMQHLEGVELHELQDKSVGLLIGLDNPALFRPLESRHGKNGEPDAVLTTLGWTLFGTAFSSSQENDYCFHVSTLTDRALTTSPYDNVISCGLECDNSKEDRIALEQMERSVKLVNGHFQLPLLWRDKQTVLPDNRAVAQSRLESLKRRLIRDDQLHQLYAKTMQNYIDHGYAEPVPGDVEVASRRWFLPHHSVTNPNKPGKVRIVFDCASRCKGVSLNGVLMQGPQLSLPDDSPLFEKGINVVTTLVSTKEAVFDPPMDRLVKYFSSWHGFKRTAAWWVRFADYIRRSAGVLSRKSVEIGVDELQEAELRLLKYDQRCNLPHLVAALENGKDVTAAVCPLVIRKLNPVLDDGLVRVGGRLATAPVEYNQRHPIILCTESHMTELIVKHYHETVGHSGVGHTFTALRARYWIHGGSVAVRGVLGKCLSCRRNFKPCEQQIMADLPTARLSVGRPPFFHTGVDLFGPFLVKQGRSVVKRYGCIFTCMTVRAVHLEVVHSLSADSFISALRRFVSRRSNVAHLHSDNGSNFTGADRIFCESIRDWNQHQIGGFLLQREIEWHFNTPLASHFGGAWERLIRSVRKVMRSLHSGATFSDEGLITLLTEVESIINSRPLTPISFVEDFDRPLTPKDLLVLQPDSGLPPVITRDSDTFFPQRWRHIQHYSDLFWKRWVKEYLPSLVPRQKWYDAKPNVRKGDIVILKNEDMPRSQWPLGRVIDTFADPKGFVRSVLVKTSTGNLKRPISKICVIVPDHEAGE